MTGKPLARYSAENLPWQDRSDAPIFAGAVSSAPMPEVAGALGALGGPQCSAVSFAPGAHTHWHVHTTEQILIGLDGTGRIATRADEVPIGPGAVVIVPAGVEHYHAASAESPMSHLSVLAGETAVTERIKDAQAEAGRS